MNDSLASASAASAAAEAGLHDVSTPSIIFVPPPLPAFLTAPCRPGFQQQAVRLSTPCTQLPPRPKLRRCAWSKIPASRVVGRNNVWTVGDRLCRGYQLDFERIEELFSVAANTSTPPSSPSSSTGVKYPASLSASGPQESASRPSTISTSKPRVKSFEVSCINLHATRLSSKMSRFRCWILRQYYRTIGIIISPVRPSVCDAV